EIKFIQKYFPTGLDTIELGSSLGVVSSFIRSKMSKESRLICVEAFPDLCELTIKNLQLNRAYENTTVLNSALNYSDESTHIFFNPGESNTTGSISTDKIQENSIKISKTSLRNVKEVSRISEYILVMDIEGAEIEIILKEEESLKDCRHLFVELHQTTFDNQGYGVDDMIAILIKEHKFRLIDRNDNVCYFKK
ncbi:FkbM family methyltransferase, partial [Akkermansiaceae bacterium]|nr:FkbM family methyltransferase [Akkermansiaceae bacterium]